MTIENNITICTVSLNSEDTIGATIESVQQQSEPCVIHVIKDGVSTDNTAKIASLYKDVRFYSKKDAGIYDAMNQALAKVTTKYVHFLNSDDCYASTDILEKVLEKMEREHLDVLFCGIQLVDENNKVLRNWAMGRFKFLQKMGVVQAPHPGMFMRTSTFERLNYRFSTHYKISSDYELQYLVANSHILKWERSDIIAVKMRTGGESTQSISAIVIGLRECVDILRRRRVNFPRIRILLKFISKMGQYVGRKNNCQQEEK